MRRLLVFAFALAAYAQAPNPDAFYQIGPDSLPQDGVPKGEIRGPFTLPARPIPARITPIGSTSPRSTMRRFPPA